MTSLPQVVSSKKMKTKERLTAIILSVIVAVCATGLSLDFLFMYLDRPGQYAVNMHDGIANLTYATNLPPSVALAK
jgi:hypothetical protein